MTHEEAVTELLVLRGYELDVNGGNETPLTRALAIAIGDHHGPTHTDSAIPVLIQWFEYFHGFPQLTSRELVAEMEENGYEKSIQYLALACGAWNRQKTSADGTSSPTLEDRCTFERWLAYNRDRVHDNCSLVLRGRWDGPGTETVWWVENTNER